MARPFGVLFAIALIIAVIGRVGLGVERERRFGLRLHFGIGRGDARCDLLDPDGVRLRRVFVRGGVGVVSFNRRVGALRLSVLA